MPSVASGFFDEGFVRHLHPESGLAAEERNIRVCPKASNEKESCEENIGNEISNGITKSENVDSEAADVAELSRVQILEGYLMSASEEEVLEMVVQGGSEQIGIAAGQRCWLRQNHCDLDGRGVKLSEAHCC